MMLQKKARGFGLLIIVLFSICFSFLGGVRFKNRDLGFYIGRDVVRDLSGHAPWIKNAEIKRVGDFFVIASSRSDSASFYVMPNKYPYYPVILSEGALEKGSGRSISIVDANNHEIDLADTNEDGVFDSLAFTYGSSTNRVGLFDRNFDGIYDVRISTTGTTKEKEILVSNSWFKLSHRPDGKLGVVTPSGLCNYAFRDGRWIIEGERNP